MYSFFAASAYRWNILIEHTQFRSKSHQKHTGVHIMLLVKPLKDKLDECVAAIEALCGPRENVDTRGTAQGLLPVASDFLFLCYFYCFWAAVLEEVDLHSSICRLKT